MVSYNLRGQDNDSSEDAGNITQDIRQMAETAGFDEYSVMQPSPEAGWCKFAFRGWTPQYVKWHQMQTLQAKQLTTLTKCGIKREYGFK